MFESYFYNYRDIFYTDLKLAIQEEKEAFKLTFLMVDLEAPVNYIVTNLVFGMVVIKLR